MAGETEKASIKHEKTKIFSKHISTYVKAVRMKYKKNNLVSSISIVLSSLQKVRRGKYN